MKKVLLLLTVITILFAGCKKDEPKEQLPEGLKVDISNITSNTKIYIHIYKNDVLYSKVDGAYADQQTLTLSYSTPVVNSGDVLTVKYKSDRSGSSNGAGKATVKYSYKGQELATTTGEIGFPDWKTLSVTIP